MVREPVPSWCVVTVTEQLPPASVQFAELKVSVPSEDENAMVPPGVVAPAPAVSATVTETLLPEPVVIEDGVSVSLTETERAETLTPVLTAGVKPLLEAVSV
jgi:hypothetical protein